MGRVLSRDDSSYKLAGMKKGIFEEQQEIWGGIVGEVTGGERLTL